MIDEGGGAIREAGPSQAHRISPDYHKGNLIRPTGLRAFLQLGSRESILGTEPA